jgi:hypothetical protein
MLSMIVGYYLYISIQNVWALVTASIRSSTSSSGIRTDVREQSFVCTLGQPVSKLFKVLRVSCTKDAGVSLGRPTSLLEA